MSDQVTRVTQPTIEAALTDAFELFGEIEAALDKQIYPEQAKGDDDFDVPSDREYIVTLTAKEWQRYSTAMLMLERTLRLVKQN